MTDNNLSIFGKFSESAKQFKSVSAIATTAMLIAVGVLLQFFALPIGDFIRISFTFIAYVVIAMMYGPVVSGVAAVLMDILKYAIKPVGAFFPGFTLSALLVGVIYGIAFYKKKKVTLPNIIVTQLIIDVFVHIGLNTLWLTMLYNKAASVLLPMRLAKTFATLPFEIIILVVVVKATERIRKQLKK